MKELILVTQRLERVESYHEEREMLDTRWHDLLTRSGFFPVPVSCQIAAKDYFTRHWPAGILLTGGNDLAVVNPQNKLNRKRDKFEFELLDAAIRHKIPVLGVCRGMQLINHYFGGRIESRDCHVAVKHQIRFASQSFFFQPATSRRTVNSYHRFSVIETGKGIKAVAFAPDGSIEAVEHKKYKMAGIMWHPERCRPFGASDMQLFKKVFNRH